MNGKYTKLENLLRQAVKKWSSAFYFQKFKTTNDRFRGGGVNYQMQIVTTKWNIQTYQLQMIDSWGGGCKLPKLDMWNSVCGLWNYNW